MAPRDNAPAVRDPRGQDLVVLLFLVIHCRADQEKDEKHGKDENRQPAIVAYSVPRPGGDEKPADSHDGGAETENPVREICHSPFRS